MEDVKPDPLDQKTPGGIILPHFKNEKDHADDLTKFFSGVSRIEKRIPSLIDFAFKISHAIQHWANEKDINTVSLKLGNLYWTPNGDICFTIEYDPYDLTPHTGQEYLKTGYARLPKLAKLFPCVVDLVIMLGMQLSNMIDNKQLAPGGATFADLQFFTDHVDRLPAWNFRLFDAKRRKVKSRKFGL